jgi:Domain of unknown function (DUF4352)
VARVLVVAAAAVFAFVMAAVILPAQAVNPRDAIGPSASTPAAPGETLAVGGVEYRTAALEFKKEVQWGKASGSIERAAGQWAIVRVEVTNTTSQFERVPWLRVSIRSGEGTYRLNDSLSRLLSRASGYGSIDDTIAPGARITTLLVFDVPTSRGLTLEIQGGLLSLN